ncbi:MAG: AI-2E family transporter [Kiloniellales bacterium]
MNQGRQLRFWSIAIAVFLLLLYLLRDILLPFVAGMAFAYLLDPICDRLESRGLSRTLATAVVSLAFLLVVALILVLIVPLLVQQTQGLIENLPNLMTSARQWVEALLSRLTGRFDSALLQQGRDALAGVSADAVAWAGGVLGGIVTGGLALFNLLSLVFITPLVTFYLLRDWDHIVAKIDDALPREHAETVRAQAREVDRILAGFVRGQTLVCLILATFYGAALSLAGLDFGLAIGILSGLLSFIPFLGSAVGLILSVGLAFLQFDNWISIAIVAAIFLIGQAVEGNFLTPKLVGDRVGLHPVWVIFGLLAGGLLFGFVGVLIAVPLSAVVGVGVRFAVTRYKDSGYYRGGRGQLPPATGGGGEG